VSPPIWKSGELRTASIRRAVPNLPPQKDNCLPNFNYWPKKGASLASCREGFQRACPQHLLAVRGIATPAVPSEGVWSESEAVSFYERSLGEFGRIAERKVSQESNNGRKRTFEEFSRFLQRNPFGVTVENASAADVGAFIVGDWIPRHSGNCRTVLPATGERVASTSAVKGVVKHLSKTYSLLGYDNAHNLAKAEVVKSFRDGYERDLHEEGVKVQQKYSLRRSWTRCLHTWPRK
jgi:hypothetical protein